ncbi:O-antigen ligase family protein [Arthrobacter crystallopoietes]|uniref:O-antigen ligase family protein n=1 Tax=Crystallibacter crystallopoietes TaxID=37928 RepID=UPI00147B6691|nr:O-antigen ligase family protein [Arthrobacter crystallopoietes]
MIPVLAILLAFGKAPLLLNSKILSFALVILEILISQTLSIVLAAAVGIAFGLILNWRHTSLTLRALSLIAVLTTALLAGGAIGSESRFNLLARADEASANYRVTEMATVGRIVSEDPITMLIGSGPGSMVIFSGEDISEKKRDTHNVYVNILLKSGSIGILLFSIPYFTLCVRLYRTNHPLARSMIAVLAAIAFVSISVPFLWSSGGLLALLAIVTAARWPHPPKSWLTEKGADATRRKTL